LKDSIKIAAGQGFWGDLIDAPIHQVTKGPIDYLMMDYLAEVTMSILQKQKLRNPLLGYARDIPPLMSRLLPLLKERGVKLVTNGGGVNPIACRDAIFDIARKIGISDLKIGIVQGDNIIDRLEELFQAGVFLNNMDTGQSAQEFKKKILSANVYFGAAPVVEALQQEADIVITGRVTDTGLTLAPMLYEFGWKCDGFVGTRELAAKPASGMAPLSQNDWNKLAAGTVAGHIIECGGQASGGNFHGGWENVPDLANIGFPIVEAYPDGTFYITKHPNTGGLVSVETISEQLVYEIGDPKSYITPDCVVDFTSIKLEQAGENRVRVFDVKGYPATDSYKVSMSYNDGFSASATLTYSAPDALKKAKAADAILRERLKSLGLKFDEIRTEYLGYNSSHGEISERAFGARGLLAKPASGMVHLSELLPEVIIRIGVRSRNRAAVERFGKEIAPLILTGPPGVTGFSGGRPKPSDVIAYWPALIPKSFVKPEVIVEGI
jgi:hypothetical protein